MADTQEFKTIADQVRNLSKTPTDDEYADMYSLYKQATSGDCDRAEPTTDDVKEKLKYKAWSGKKGMTKEEAAKKYIEMGKKVIEKYGVK